MTVRATRQRPWALVLFGVLFGLGLVTPFMPQAQQEDEYLKDSPYLRIDPEKIVLSDRDTRVPCGECHGLEYEAWQQTDHATGFDDLHRSEQAQAILDRMGFGLSKRESLCLKCHYTAVIKRDQARAIAGVSCESCHGAARDWIAIHNDYGGATHETETDEHKVMRIAESEAGGMLRPNEDLYAVAANCFECHTVPHERLINEGGHPSGSNFELLDWSEAIRHNFLQAQWSNDETNRAPSEGRKRMMYIVGRILDYEYSIRGMAEASQPGIYAKAMERRTKKARREVEKILRLQEIPEVAAVLQIGDDARLVPDNKDGLTEVADAISEATQMFARDHDGSAFAAVDPLVRGEDVALPEPEEPEPAVADAADGTPAASGGAASGGVVADAGGSAGDTPAAGGNEASASATPATPRVQVVGEARRRPAWFTSSSHEVLGPSGCSCHIDQQNWWAGDAHNASALAILDESPRAVQIASNYGLSRREMKLGNRMCMSCHGTVVAGEESEEVYEGVSCESCHGPGSDYRSTHPAEKYAGSASKGMVQLEQASARADNCARCHHITDERLLSSGHPSGAGFTLADRNAQIVHWQAPQLAAGDLNSAFQRAIGGRPIPDVPVAQVTAPPAPARTRRPAAAARPAGQPTTPPPAPPSVRPVPGTPTAAAAPSDDGGASAGGAATPAAPAASGPRAARPADDVSTEDLIASIKQRLEALYRAAGRGE